MEFVRIKRRVPGKWSSFWRFKRYSAIWCHSWEHLKNVFCCQSGSPGQCTWILTENILRMFSRIRPDCRTAQTPPERAWFLRTLPFIWKHSIRYKSRYLKKILPEEELKIVTNPVIWSRGFPTVIIGIKDVEETSTENQPATLCPAEPGYDIQWSRSQTQRSVGFWSQLICIYTVLH